MSKDYLTLVIKSQNRYLDSFRGEPAITKLEWPFTPNYKSSQNYATVTSSALRNFISLLIIRSFSFGSNTANCVQFNYASINRSLLGVLTH